MASINDLTIDEYAKGAKLSLENAERHLSIATKIAEINNFGMAISHLVLTLEELAKATVLKIRSCDYVIQIKNLEEYFRKHNVKHEALIRICTVALLESITTDDQNRKNGIVEDNKFIMFLIVIVIVIAVMIFLKDEVVEKLERIPHVLNEMRNKGFYVDYDFEGKTWLTPVTIHTESEYKETKEIVTLLVEYLKRSLFADKISKQDILRFIRNLTDENIITPDLKDDLKEIEGTLS